MAELFLQYIENKHIKQNLDSKNIIFYTRYVDGMLIIYTTPDALQNYVNHIHSSLQLNPTYENNAQINFLEFPLSHRSDRQP
jgi:hypothetical protein